MVSNPKRRTKKGKVLRKKLPSGKFENNREEFSKNVRWIKHLGLKLVLFARPTYAALGRLIQG
jgi:hypothetical protein